MPDPLKPAAIVRPAEVDEKWDIHVKAAIGFAKRSTQACALAGAELLKAKVACPHGLWRDTLKKHGIAPATARYWMLSFGRFSQMDNVAHLTEIASLVGVSGQHDEQEPPAYEIGDEPADHPLIVELVLCKNCKRKGRAKDCKTCQALRERFVGSGKGGKKKRKGGSVLFSWKAYDTHLSAIYTLPDRLAKAYPDTAKSSEHHEASRLLDQLARVVEKLQKLVEGVK